MYTRTTTVKMQKRRIAAVLLAPILVSVGLAAPAQAADPTLTKDGCRATLRAPQRLTAGSPYIDYMVVATCGPNSTMELAQKVLEDDTGIFDGNDLIAQRTTTSAFTQTSGTITRVVHYIVRLPDTEGGAEEMFHELRFRVRSGPLVGGWTSTAQSRNASFTN